jgi:hypothetical protein
LIETNNCTLNCRIPTRTDAEWRQANKERVDATKRSHYERNKDEIKERSNNRYQANKEQILAQVNQYRTTHIEEIRERKKQYNAKNAEKIAEHKNEKVICNICGGSATRCHLLRHQRTIKCQSFINQQ